MSEQAPVGVESNELRGSLTVMVPVSVLERLRPFASRRAKSRFVTEAIRAALDQADQDRERAAV
jgi:flagellar motor switch protein FliM